MGSGAHIASAISYQIGSKSVTIETLAILAAALLVLAALGLGGFWGAARARREAQAQQEQAVAQARAQALMEAQATANTQIATAQERVRGLEAERAGLLAELQHLRTQADSWREALDAARDERAQLAERAARVPGRPPRPPPLRPGGDPSSDPT